MNITAKYVEPYRSILSVWERMKICLVKNAEALKWTEYYLWLPLLVKYRNMLQEKPVVAVKNAVRLLHALMEAHADVDKNMDRR